MTEELPIKADAIVIDKADHIHVDRSQEVNVQGEVVRVDGETIPVDKWRAILWVLGKVAKGGPTAFVLFVLIGWYLWDGQQIRKRDEARQDKVQEVLSVLATNQATLIKSVDQKNSAIDANHDMLISSRDRDERIIRLLTDVGEQLHKAGEIMSPLPEERKKQTKLLEDIRDGIQQLRNGS